MSVPWLDGYFAIPSCFKLQKSKSFQTARIYGQDVSSGAAVAALLSNIHDIGISNDDADASAKDANTSLRVLDLCCCPGLKLCAIADALYKEQKNGDLFGVDISEPRMSICKRILHKYQIQPSFNQSFSQEEELHDNLRQIQMKLYCNDGTKLATMDCTALNLVFDSTIAIEDEVSRNGKRKRMNKSSRARESKRLKEIAFMVGRSPDRKSKIELFDRVLVDAECSTDGSIVHTQKRMLRIRGPICTDKSNDNNDSSEIDTPLRAYADNQLVELYALQRELAASGYQLLRKGGIMVYSTCSLADQQNGDVVRWLLKTYPDAKIVPLTFFHDSKSVDSADYTDIVREGSIPGTIQFLPNMDIDGPVDQNRLFGGGFYIAKIFKTAE